MWPGQSHKIETEKLNSGVDCLVTTFDRMQHRRDGEKLFLSGLEMLVIDELDTFIDSGREGDIRKLLEQYLKDQPRQVCFVSATITKQMKALVKDLMQEEDLGYKECIEKSTHMNLSNLKHEFIHIADFDKIKPLKLLMKEFKKYSRKEQTSCIVFCNSV
jgi:superfamily II DNA/RNA helicase